MRKFGGIILGIGGDVSLSAFPPQRPRVPIQLTNGGLYNKRGGSYTPIRHFWRILVAEIERC
jgi:hypothetical protein